MNDRRGVNLTALPAVLTSVSDLDPIKEQLAYFKLWQGIAAVTDISLIGWIVSVSAGVPTIVRLEGIAAALVLTTGVVLLHRRIQRLITQTGKLKSWRRSAAF